MLISSQQCLSCGLAHSAGCFSLLLVLLLRTCGARLERRLARGPDTMETNGEEKDPWGTAVMNGSEQFVYFSRFMGLVPPLCQGYLLTFVSRDRWRTLFVFEHSAAKSGLGT